jgi:hypothetical protein
MGLVLKEKQAPPAPGNENRPWFQQPASDQAPAATGNEKRASLGADNQPVKFYIVHVVPGQGEIETSEYVMKSPFAIIQREWTDALPEMAQRYPHRGESLEIDCHGKPGALLLQPEVNRTTLPTFAAAARELLRPYRTVEFLACKVANYDVASLIKQLKSMYGRKPDVEFLNAWLGNRGGSEWEDGLVADSDTVNGISDSFKSISKTEKAQKATATGLLAQSVDWGLTDQQRKQLVTDYMREQLEGSRGSRGLVLRPVAPAKPARAGAANLDHARVARLAMETGLDVIGDCYNGPLFCSRAARLLRCTVRAAMAKQPGAMTAGLMDLPEYYNTYDYKVMSIGNWQGHVFDFTPGGEVTYVGLNVKRSLYVQPPPEGEGYPLRNA